MIKLKNEPSGETVWEIKDCRGDIRIQADNEGFFLAYEIDGPEGPSWVSGEENYKDLSSAMAGVISILQANIESGFYE